MPVATRLPTACGNGEHFGRNAGSSVEARRCFSAALAGGTAFYWIFALHAFAQSPKQQWKTLPSPVRYNDDAPKSWNVYRGDHKGVYLVRLWKRYLLVDTNSQSAFEIDPAKVLVSGEQAALSAADIPSDPLEIAEWKTRNAGPVLRHRFRFGPSGNFLELQIPVLPNGKPAY
jgi:hypothetical protein